MSSKFIIIRVLLFVLLVVGTTSAMIAQDNDFATWTKFKVNHKIDSRFAVSGDLELRTEDDMGAIDRWGISVGGDYRAFSFLKFEIGYETHYRNLGEIGWKFRHRYRIGATASFRYQWLKMSLRERFQQTFDRAPQKGIVSPYFSIEIYQSLDDAPFWRTARLRYRPGIEIDLTKRWSLDAFYCYQYESSRGKHIAGVEVGYSF